VKADEPEAGAPPQVPPTEAMYPEFGVTVKAVVEPPLTDCGVLGEMVPLAPALGVTVKVPAVNVAVTVQLAVMAPVV
jgi:hypothetical protein